MVFQGREIDQCRSASKGLESVQCEGGSVKIGAIKIEKHGLSVGVSRVGSEFFLTIKAVRNLTHEDYQVITPMIDSALEGVSDARIKALFDATEMEGWELRAAWDDFKLGVKHGKEFERIAIFGNKKWQEMTAKVANWFLSGEVKFFEDEESALAWLGE